MVSLSHPKQERKMKKTKKKRKREQKTHIRRVNKDCAKHICMQTKKYARWTLNVGRSTIEIAKTCQINDDFRHQLQAFNRFVMENEVKRVESKKNEWLLMVAMCVFICVARQH